MLTLNEYQGDDEEALYQQLDELASAHGLFTSRARQWQLDGV